MIRNVYNLPMRTHRYLIEPISGTLHLMSMLTNRFIKFYNTLYTSDKSVVNNLCRVQEHDMRFTFGCNIMNLWENIIHYS